MTRLTTIFDQAERNRAAFSSIVVSMKAEGKEEWLKKFYLKWVTEPKGYPKSGTKR